jgi:predicted aspartyl protease
LGNYFQIPVKLFGQTNSMLVDTGASCAMLDASFLPRLGKSLASRSDFVTSSSTTTVNFYNCPEIFIDENRFAPLVTIIGDFRAIRQAAGEPIGAILGLSCLKYHVICFDSDNARFSIGGSVPQSVKHAAAPLELIETNRGYVVSARINGRGPVYLMIDSGDNGSVDLNEADWQKVFAGERVHSWGGKYLAAEGKPTENRYARARSLTIGTNTYKNIVTGTLKNLDAVSQLGQTIFRRNLCYFDFPNHKLYLVPGRHFNDPDEHDMSGLHLLQIDGRVTVYSADNDSPASAAGIKPNDQILSINGQPASSFHLASIRDLLRTKPGDEIKLQLKRGDEAREVSFRLKRFL